MTDWIAVAIGVYSLAAGCALLMDERRLAAILDSLHDNAALAYITGVVVYTIGVILLLAHHGWGGWLTGLVTLIGWFAVVEGLVIIVVPGPFIGGARRFIAAGSSHVWSAVAIVFGIVLLVGGVAGLG